MKNKTFIKIITVFYAFLVMFSIAMIGYDIFHETYWLLVLDIPLFVLNFYLMTCSHFEIGLYYKVFQND